jgi:Uncharacterized protein conserved in bacteria (DUF2325)
MSTRLPGIHVPLPAQFAPARLPVHLSEMTASQPARAEQTRRRIWELGSSFHCSIIGTCLTAAELRQILLKTGLPGIDKQTDHDLHARAVLMASKRDVGSKILQKALDRRHRSALIQFGKARNDAELRALWANAIEKAEIPGAYWAVLTHAQTTEELARDVFGEVHMLSHLVGAANRADIRRLRALEAENAALQAKVARQQQQLRNVVVQRDATIADLQDMLGKAIASRQAGASLLDAVESRTAAQVIADLRRRLASLTANCERLERRVSALTTERDHEWKCRRSVELVEQEQRAELQAAEQALEAAFSLRNQVERSLPKLAGTTVLYVGGRAHLVPKLQLLAEQTGAEFVHHDGGIEDRTGLLEAQVARADAVFFPVDCVSHGAVAVVKRISRHATKPYVPLRSSGLSSFAAALQAMALRRDALVFSEQSSEIAPIS